MHSFQFFATLIFLILINVFVTNTHPVKADTDTGSAYFSRPNRETGLERFLGLGVVLPYPYFQKPKYRYPVYDRSGRGYLVYGFGGQETYQYKDFNPVDGLH